MQKRGLGNPTSGEISPSILLVLPKSRDTSVFKYEPREISFGATYGLVCLPQHPVGNVHESKAQDAK